MVNVNMNIAGGKNKSLYFKPNCNVYHINLPVTIQVIKLEAPVQFFINCNTIVMILYMIQYSGSEMALTNSLVPVMAMVKVSMRSLGLILPELLVSRARKMFLSTISASHLIND